MKITSASLKSKASLNLGHLLVKRQPGDRYIVAHPRSGSTWLRTVVVNVLRPDANSNPDVFNEVIPGVSIRNTLRRVNKLPPPRVISSHTSYRRGLPAVVYLVRDGRDVLVSFYHYKFTRRGRAEEKSFSDFFDLYCQQAYGVFWPHHVESWLERGMADMGERLMVVRFEDMKTDPEGIFSAVLQFLGIPAPVEILRPAIEAASMEQMRQWEKRRLQDGADPNAAFYRGGHTGQWLDYFTPSMEERFYALSERVMKLAGYTL